VDGDRHHADAAQRDGAGAHERRERPARPDRVQGRIPDYGRVKDRVHHTRNKFPDGGGKVR